MQSFGNMSQDTIIEKFYEIILNSFDIFVPKYKFNINLNHNTKWPNPILKYPTLLKKNNLIKNL